MIMPFWRGHKDWAYVANDGVHVNAGIAEVQIFRPRYQKGALVRSPVFHGFPKFPSLVLKFTEEAKIEPFESRVTRSHCLLKGCKKCWNNKSKIKRIRPFTVGERINYFQY